MAALPRTVAPPPRVASPPIPRPRVDEGRPFDECVVSLYAPEAELLPPVQRARAEVARRFRLDQADADDIVQEAILQVCLHHAQDPYRNLPAAFWRAVANAAKDLGRHRARVRECSFDELQGPVAHGGCWVPGTDPDGVLSLAERRLVQSIWCHLQPVEQAVVERRLVLGMSFREIGVDVRLTETQTKDAYHNAVKRLRAMYASHRCR